MLVPMLTDEQMRTNPPSGQGQLIFNKEARGFFYFDGLDWQPLLMAEREQDGEGLKWVQQRTGEINTGAPKLTTGTSGFWDLTGNAASNPSFNFIGTTDAQPVRFRANNTFAGQLSGSTIGGVFLGFNAGPSNSGNFNTFLGPEAGLLNTTGEGNTFVGRRSGASNTTGGGNTLLGAVTDCGATGTSNTFVGSEVLGQNSDDCVAMGSFVGVGSGTANTIIGNGAGQLLTSGDNNTFLGRGVGSGLATGNSLTLLGANTTTTASGLTNACAIGRAAAVGANNSLVLGGITGVNGGSSVNVGIGTTTPADRLHVVGNLRMVDGNQGAGKVLTSDANGRATWQLPAAATGWGLTGNAGTNATTNFIGTTDAVDFRIRTGNTARISISSAGRVGVGNTAPLVNLDVSGGLALRAVPLDQVGPGTTTIAVGDRSFVRLLPTVNANFILGDGLQIGQLLYLLNVGTFNFTATVADNPATTNCNLVATRALGPKDTLTLVWDGTDWIELGFANN